MERIDAYLPDWVEALSVRSHGWIFGGQPESWCAHAFRCRGQSRFWAGWVRLFSHGHCRASFIWHHLVP